MRFAVRTLAWWAVVAPVPAMAAAPLRAQESLAERVNVAIDRGAGWLKAQQKPDGSFPCDHWCPVGATALSTYALLKSGVLARDPVVQKALDWLRYQPFQHTYAVSVEIAMLDALGAIDDQAVERQLLDAAQWIEEHQRDDGLWAYPEKVVDLSNSQYAALGLWVAARHGFKAKRETWGKLLKEVARRQNPDGGFGYHEGDGSTGSMTTAGVALLELALDGVADDPRYGSAREKAKAALPRAWKWLEEFFTVDGNPNGDRTVVFTNQLYYLFGLERVAAIGGKKRIGDHDWYAEGATRLVRIQQPEGRWHDVDATSFALLFLRRATFTGMSAATHKEGGTAASPSAEPGGIKRPRASVSFLRRWLVCGPIADPKHELLEAPYAGELTVEPKTASVFRGRSWTEQRTLGSFVGFGPDARPGDATISYAFTYLHVSETTDAVLWFGSDDGARLFVDGKQVFERHVHAVAEHDRSSVPVQLGPGVHRLLVKVENAKGPSGFYLRCALADGTTAKAIRPALSKTDPQEAACALALPELFTPRELSRLLPPLPRLAISFDTQKDLELFAYDHVSDWQDRYPVWYDLPPATTVSPHPGARGVLGVHPLSAEIPARIWFRATVPAGERKLCLRVSNEGYGSPGRADVALRVGILAADADEKPGVPRVPSESGVPGEPGPAEAPDAMDWQPVVLLGPTPAPDPGAWRTLEIPLGMWTGASTGSGTGSGRDPAAPIDVLFAIECASGGVDPLNWENAFFDEIAIR